MLNESVCPAHDPVSFARLFYFEQIALLMDGRALLIRLSGFQGHRRMANWAHWRLV
jgi:hypothetical protein